jgi:hypothetical protein
MALKYAYLLKDSSLPEVAPHDYTPFPHRNEVIQHLLNWGFYEALRRLKDNEPLFLQIVRALLDHRELTGTRLAEVIKCKT